MKNYEIRALPFGIIGVYGIVQGQYLAALLPALLAVGIILLGNASHHLKRRKP